MSENYPRSARRSLGTADALVLVVGLVLGVGIFRAPQLVAVHSPGPAAFLGFWLLGGVISLLGALCYAELASSYPSSGGEYHFVERAFGAGVGFVFGWSRLTVLQTGSIAMLAFVFADYAVPLLGLHSTATPLLAGLAVAALTGLHLLGLRAGRAAQYGLTLLEVAGLLAVIAATGLLVGEAGMAVPDPVDASVPREATAPTAPGVALVFVMLTYGGWSEAAYLSADVRRPRSICWALLGGMAIITGLYLLANAAYLWALGLTGVAGSPAVAAELLARAVGPVGSSLVSGIVMIAALSSANATMLTGARSNLALGDLAAPLAFLAVRRGPRETPVNAVLVQGAIVLLLVVLGAFTRSGFETMVAYTAPVFWLLLLLCGLALFRLRRRDPAAARPFRVPLYPLVPLLFCLAAAYMLLSSLSFAGPGALLGLAVLAVGVPIHLARRASAISTAFPSIAIRRADRTSSSKQEGTMDTKKDDTVELEDIEREREPYEAESTDIDEEAAERRAASAESDEEEAEGLSAGGAAEPDEQAASSDLDESEVVVLDVEEEIVSAGSVDTDDPGRGRKGGRDPDTRG